MLSMISLLRRTVAQCVQMRVNERKSCEGCRCGSKGCEIEVRDMLWDQGVNRSELGGARWQ
eukprot:980253-Prymnesium_polylepis.1